MLGRPAVADREAVGAQHPEVTRDRLQAAVVSGRADDGVGAQPRTVDEHDIGRLEALEPGHDARAPRLQRGNEAIVDGRADPGAPELRLEPLRRARYPVPREVPEDQALEQEAPGVADLRG
jgi:hypothetical protein